jgi:hypothetical protein
MWRKGPNTGRGPRDHIAHVKFFEEEVTVRVLVKEYCCKKIIEELHTIEELLLNNYLRELLLD